MIIKPDQLEYALAEISPIWDDFETFVLQDFTRRLVQALKNQMERGDTEYEFPGSARNEAIQGMANGVSVTDVLDRLQEALDLSDKQIAEVFQAISQVGEIQQDQALSESGLNVSKYETEPQLQNYIDGAIQQTHGTMQNLSGSTALGFAVEQPNGKIKSIGLQDFYQSSIDQAVTRVSTGVQSYQEAIWDATKKVSRSGVRVIYPSGYTDLPDVAIRRAVLTGVNQMMQAQNKELAKKLGSENWEVTAHEGARPTHKVWQGKVYTSKQLEEICGLGAVDGLCGANCRHTYHPFLKGQKRAWTDEELKNIDPPDFEWKGKTYTAYEATQKQRSYERRLRVLNRKITCLEAAGDADELTNVRIKKRMVLSEYKQFSKTAGLKTKMDRCRVVSWASDPTEKKVKTTKTSIAKTTKVASKTVTELHSEFKQAKTQSKGSNDISFADYQKYRDEALVMLNDAKTKGVNLETMQAVSIIKVKKENDIRGQLILKPETPNLEGYDFDDKHINEERGHNVTREEAVSYTQNSLYVLKKWDGEFMNYFSVQGGTYINTKKKLIRTTFKPDEFDPETRALMKEILKYVR